MYKGSGEMREDVQKKKKKKRNGRDTFAQRTIEKVIKEFRRKLFATYDILPGHYTGIVTSTQSVLQGMAYAAK